MRETPPHFVQATTNLPMKYKPKVRNKPCICKLCKQQFLSADRKSTLCDVCREASLRCECGAPKDKNSKYCYECRNSKYSHTRGKTYEEIMGVEKATVLREQRIFQFKLGGKAVGEYRSQYEVAFAEFLEKNKIIFQYEVGLQGLEKDWSKIVDFYLPQFGIYIELSGYIWASRREAHQDKFLSRILELASLIPNAEFIVATEPALLSRIQNCFEGYISLGQPIRILSLYELRQYIEDKKRRHDENNENVGI